MVSRASTSLVKVATRLATGRLALKGMGAPAIHWARESYSPGVSRRNPLVTVGERTHRPALNAAGRHASHLSRRAGAQAQLQFRGRVLAGRGRSGLDAFAGQGLEKRHQIGFLFFG